MKQLTGARPVVAVVDIRAVGYTLPGARHAFAGSPEASGELATALVVSNPASKALAPVFLALSRPERPIKVFTNPERAHEWALRRRPRLRPHSPTPSTRRGWKRFH